MLDVENPRSPAILSYYTLGGNPRELALAGTLAVVAQETNGCEIIDLSEPQKPTTIARVATSGYATSVAISGPFVFVTDSWVGLLVLRCDQAFPPRLLQRPTSQLVHPGETCAFSIQADGWSTLAYQWQHNGTNLIDGPRCSGANSPTLTLADTSELDQGAYRVIVSCDGVSTTSPAATLTVSRLKLLGKSHNAFVDIGLMLEDDATMSGAAAGAYHDLALHTDGSVTAGGKSVDGQTNVPPTVTSAIAVAAGCDHSLALLADGTVVAWGRNFDGQTDVPPAATNVVAIAAGWAHSLALRGDGSVVAWGNNQYGQCAIDYRANDITAIAAGYYHSLALRVDGRVIAWGIDDSAPEWATNVTAIAGGWWHSLAVRADGTVVSWGDDTYGQTQVPSSATNIVSVSAGFYHSVAQRNDGTAVAWGRNAFGMIDQVSSLKDNCLLYAGEDHSLALTWADIPLVSPPPLRVLAPLGGMATFSTQVRASPQSTLQWSHDSTPIPGATNRSLTVHAATDLDAGEYQLVVTSPEAVVTTRSTSLEIAGFAPAVEEMRPTVAVGDGRTVEFGATVTGSRPMAYQWLRDGWPVLGATNRIVSLSPAALTDSGAYALQVTNLFGADARGETFLKVFPVTAPQDIAVALDSEDLVWTTSPDSPWTSTPTFTYDGVDALQSGPLTFGQESWVQTTVSGPAILEWAWGIPSDGTLVGSCKTRLTLERDTLPSSGTWETLRAASGPWSWDQWISDSLVLGPGGHTLRWFFEYSNGNPTDTDRAFLDQVHLSPAPSISARAGTSTTLIDIVSELKCWCTLQYTSALDPTNTWQTLQWLTLTNGTQTVELPRQTDRLEGYYRLRF